MSNHTIQDMSEGIRTTSAFEGKPPKLKSLEFLKRKERRSKAEITLKEATVHEKYRTNGKTKEATSTCETKRKHRLSNTIALYGGTIYD